MKISVIVPMYNREKYIGECIDSLVSQTYPISETEFIFVDDGSTDSTVNIVKEYEARFPNNIILVELPENSGGRAGFVRSVGMSYASGEYITFVDSDDIIDAHMLEKMFDIARQYDADVVSANMQIFSENPGIATETKAERFFDSAVGQDFIDLLTSEGLDGHIGARLYSRKYIDEHGIRFPEDRYVSEDTSFNMQCLLYRPRYYMLSDVLYYYRLNFEGLWRNNDQDPRRIMGCINTQEELYPLYMTVLYEVPELVELFFFLALSNARRRWIGMGKSGYYYSMLPSIKKRFNRYAPNIVDNYIIREQKDESMQALYRELVGDFITVDIVSPLGGDVGGVENVILKWTKEINPNKVNLRIFHCYKGGAYLKGYSKQYSVDREYKAPNLQELIEAYTAFINEYGAPDICIATNWPLMVKACGSIRQTMNLSDMKIISWIHNTIQAYDDAEFGGVDDMTEADAHFAISHQIAEDICAADAKAKVYEIGNPIDMQSGLYTVEADYHMLTYVGRLSYIKRIDIILEAIYRAKGDWKLRIIGSGEIEEEVKGWIDLLKLNDRVMMMDWTENPWMECQDSRILVMASEYEGFPMTACEAASRGMTIISTPVQGIEDYVRQGETGYFFPFEDAKALADILDGLYDGGIDYCDPSLCRESVLKYETDRYFENVMKAFDDVLR